MPAKRRLLIYDSSLSGHHPDYLNAVLGYCVGQSAIDCLFMVPEAFAPTVLEKASKAGNVAFRFLDHNETRSINALQVRERARFELRLIRAQIELEKQAGSAIDECVLMYLDYFQPVLGSADVQDFPASIAGVLFQPYTRVEQVASRWPWQPRLMMKALRKRYRLARMLRSGCVKRIVVPCDEPAVAILNARHHRWARFEMLPEPYFNPSLVKHQASSAGAVDIRHQYGICAGRKILLVFGRIIARKNVPRIIQAYSQLDPQQQQNITLLVLGSADESYRVRLQECVRQAAESNPQGQVIYDHSYVDNATVEAAFEQCEVVAMPYLKAYQSSGILFLAARHNKPVLAPDEGLVHELVTRYQLGVTVNVRDVSAIAQGIRQTISQAATMAAAGADIPANQTASGGQLLQPATRTFLMRHTPQSHGAVILDSAL